MLSGGSGAEQPVVSEIPRFQAGDKDESEEPRLTRVRDKSRPPPWGIAMALSCHITTRRCNADRSDEWKVTGRNSRAGKAWRPCALFPLPLFFCPGPLKT